MFQIAQIVRAHRRSLRGHLETLQTRVIALTYNKHYFNLVKAGILLIDPRPLGV